MIELAHALHKFKFSMYKTHSMQYSFCFGTVVVVVVVIFQNTMVSLFTVLFHFRCVDSFDSSSFMARSFEYSKYRNTVADFIWIYFGLCLSMIQCTKWNKTTKLKIKQKNNKPKN